jgi:acetylornithine deacetylase/succinyl-diaminopimelate desuccinylase-like protein
MKGAKVAKLVRDFVKKRNPDVAVEIGSSAPAFKGRITGPYVEAAQRAVKFAFGKEPVFVREGGTIGAVLSMEQLLRVPIVFMGLSLPDHGYHAPNENYDWGQAGGGMVAFAKFFEEASGITASRPRAARG